MQRVSLYIFSALVLSHYNCLSALSVFSLRNLSLCTFDILFYWFDFLPGLVHLRLADLTSVQWVHHGSVEHQQTASEFSCQSCNKNQNSSELLFTDPWTANQCPKNQLLVYKSQNGLDRDSLLDFLNFEEQSWWPHQYYWSWDGSEYWWRCVWPQYVKEGTRKLETALHSFTA